VNNWRHEVIKFIPSSYPPGPETTDSAAGTIDPGPANGVKFDPTSNRIYVDDGSYVAGYEPTGAPVGVNGKPLRIGEGTLKEGYGLAVSAYPETEGEIYVPDAATNTVKVYDPSVSLSEPVQVIEAAARHSQAFPI
jgi:DNA-binding beta-propeller fold protein YncE